MGTKLFRKKEQWFSAEGRQICLRLKEGKLTRHKEYIS